MPWAWITAPAPPASTGVEAYLDAFGPGLPGPFGRCSSDAGLPPCPGSLWSEAVPQLYPAERRTSPDRRLYLCTTSINGRARHRALSIGALGSLALL